MIGLPTGWAAVTLAELGAAGEQTVLTGPFGSNLGREDFVSSGVPVLTIGCLGTDGISKSKILHVSAPTAKLKPEISENLSWVRPFFSLIRLTFWPTNLRISMQTGQRITYFEFINYSM
jgi:hypothetical protein